MSTPSSSSLSPVTAIDLDERLPEPVDAGLMVEALLRPVEQRRRMPDRGIVLLQAKGRLGPQVWALYGRADRPVLLKDDRYLDDRHNDFYRDANGHAFVLLPLIAEDDPNRFELADTVFRRLVALGINERPELFFTCVYQFQLPDYRVIAIHDAQADEVLEEDKCLQLAGFEKARLADSLGATTLLVQAGKKIRPVSLSNEVKPSNNLWFALNTLVLHHGYDEARLNEAWSAL